MSRWWVGVAVIAGSLASPALAQNPPTGVPTPYGAARTPPEPLPVGACPTPVPVMFPGPLTPDQAPASPGSEFDLPANSPGAFQCENFPQELAVYFSAGTQSLEHAKLGKGGLALVDTTLPDPTNKRGVAPLTSSPIAQRFNDIAPDLNFGPRGTIGVLAGSDMIELTGYWIPSKSNSTTAKAPGRISAFFYNAPPGFEGDNGLFNQADRITSTLDSEVGNIELNYRYTSAAVNEVELIFGVRYFDTRERLSTFVDQDADTHPVNGLGTPNALNQATYAVTARNRIVAPQMGFEYNQGIYSWMSVGANFKGAWGANFSNVGHSLSRGDGFSGFVNNRTDNLFSHMYELGAFVEFHLLERARVRAGYSANWVLHINSAVDQYEFNLANPQGKINNDGSLLYHGALVEMQFLF